MRYKKLGEVVSGNEDVIKCLADKFILIAENDDENCTKFYIVKDTEPPPPAPEKKNIAQRFFKK